MRRLFVCLLLIFAAGCSDVPTRPDGVESVGNKEYAAIVKSNTSSVDKYSGFYQTFQADMTIESTEMQTAALKRRASFQQWDRKQFTAEHEKMTQDATSYAHFFLRFFSPERDYDDLAKDKSA